MFALIKDNIRNFLDITVFLTMLAIGVYTILGDYRYFRKMKFRKDAAVTLKVGLACIFLPFLLMAIARL